MKHLLIMRHAKSSWDHQGCSDHDRPLNDRGKRDAPRMGKFIKEQGLTPDCILSSSAKRAQQTAKALARAADYSGTIDIRKDLYLADTEDYLHACRSLPDTCARAVVVAHNPGSEYIVRHFTEHDETMPTAAIAEIVLPIDSWSELNPHTRGSLRHVWRPKELHD